MFQNNAGTNSSNEAEREKGSSPEVAPSAAEATPFDMEKQCFPIRVILETSRHGERGEHKHLYMKNKISETALLAWAGL